MERTPGTNEILVLFWRFAGNLMTSLQPANCSMFVPRWQGKLGRRQWTVVLAEHPMLKSRMAADVVDQ